MSYYSGERKVYPGHVKDDGEEGLSCAQASVPGICFPKTAPVALHRVWCIHITKKRLDRRSFSIIDEPTRRGKVLSGPPFTILHVIFLRSERPRHPVFITLEAPHRTPHRSSPHRDAQVYNGGLGWHLAGRSICPSSICSSNQASHFQQKVNLFEPHGLSCTGL